MRAAFLAFAGLLALAAPASAQYRELRGAGVIVTYNPATWSPGGTRNGGLVLTCRSGSCGASDVTLYASVPLGRCAGHPIGEPALDQVAATLGLTGGANPKTTVVGGYTALSKTYGGTLVMAATIGCNPMVVVANGAAFISQDLLDLARAVDRGGGKR